MTLALVIGTKSRKRRSLNVSEVRAKGKEEPLHSKYTRDNADRATHACGECWGASYRDSASPCATNTIETVCGKVMQKRLSIPYNKNVAPPSQTHDTTSPTNKKVH